MNLKLTRNQLASFLKDPEQIKQFEQLFNTVEEIAPGGSTSNLDLGSDSALNTAQQAIATIAKFEEETNLSLGLLESKTNQVLSLISDLSTKVDGLSMEPVAVPDKRIRYGSFYDTTTQTAALINTAYAMTFNTTDLSSGVYIGSPNSRIIVDTEGIYNIQFSAQFDNTHGGNHLAFIWLRVNGVNVAQSASQIRLKSTDGELVAAWNFFYKLKANDYSELMWSASDTAVQITAQAAGAVVPAIPSVILTVSKVGD
jgi:hypothetical protein